LRRVPIERRELRGDDIAVRVEYCGVCHSDLHAIHGLMGKPTEALVPGHEFTGTVTAAAGAAVTGFAPGDRVAVGTLVDSCGVCPMCQAGQENFCYEGPVSTYGGTDRVDGTETKGGYSREYVLREKFAYRLPDGLPRRVGTGTSSGHGRDGASATDRSVARLRRATYVASIVHRWDPRRPGLPGPGCPRRCPDGRYDPLLFPRPCPAGIH
jgi:hypothetical protein